MIYTDWHNHTESSCDEASVPMDVLFREGFAAGLTAMGVTDHLHTRWNLPELLRSRAEFLRCRLPGTHFGVELSVVSRWECDRIAAGKLDGAPTYGIRSGGPLGGPVTLGLEEYELRAIGVEYVVGGVHWPMYTRPDDEKQLVDTYFQQHLFLACDSRVDIVAHPWWYDNRWTQSDGWYRDFSVLPSAMLEELTAALLEHGKCVELNQSMVRGTHNRHPASPEADDRFHRAYAEYIRSLFEAGVPVTYGTDCHDPHYIDHRAELTPLLASVGFRPGDFTQPRFRRPDREF